MNSNRTITIKKRSTKFLDYQLRQARLISYWSGLPVTNILELVQEFEVPFIYQFPNK